jgi:hypothetical protein
MNAREQLEIPTSMAYDHAEIRFHDVDALFRETVYGDILRDRSRWSGFKPDEMSDEEFQSIIGVDGNNLKHLSLTYGTTRVFLSYCAVPSSVWGDRPVPEAAQFNQKEQIVLLLTAITHDWGEASVGDTAQPHKTKKSEIKEFKELLRIANETTRANHGAFGTIFRFTEPILRHTPSEFYHRVYRGLRKLTGGDSELFAKIYESVDETLLVSDSKLSRAFNAIEKIGYHRTGMRAWERSSRFSGNENHMDERLRAMSFSVHTHNLADLVTYAKDYPPVFAHLVAHSGGISDVYATNSREAATTLQRYQGKVKATDTPNAARDDLIQKEIDALEAKFIAQREVWVAWKAEHEREITQWQKEHTSAPAAS